MNRTIKELSRTAQDVGVDISDVDVQRKGARKEIVRRLQEFYLWERYQGDVPASMRDRLSIESPMLCFRFKDLKEEEKEEVLSSKYWIAERKYNGVRAVGVYNEEEGFRFYSRHLSSVDLLPIDMSWGVPLWVEESNRFCGDVRFSTAQSFMFDCEITSDRADVGVGLDGSTSYLGAIVALTNASPKNARKEIERINEPFVRVHVFDLLKVDDVWLLDQPLGRRLVKLRDITKRLKEIPSFREAEFRTKKKMDFFSSILKDGGEGVVFKNLLHFYKADTGRSRSGWVKMKRSMSGAVLDDIDVWIGGFELGTEGKRHEEKIGTLHLYVLLTEEDESSAPFHIASVSSMPDWLRDKMTQRDEDGVVVLNPRYFERVLTIDGMSVSAKNLKIAHAVVDWQNCWRDDKTKEDCEIRRETLTKNVI